MYKDVSTSVCPKNSIKDSSISSELINKVAFDSSVLTFSPPEAF